MYLSECKGIWGQEWLNLAQSYMINGGNKEACEVLVMGSKIESTDWEIWRDLLVVSTDCGYYRRAIRAYLKLLELKQSYINLVILETIIDGIFEKGVLGVSTRFKSEQREKIMTIYEKHTDFYPKSPPLWCSYGIAIAKTYENPDSDFRDITIKTLFMAVRVLLEERSWFLFDKRVKHVLKNAKKIALAFAICSDLFPGTPECQKLLVMAKEFLNDILDKVEEYQKNILTDLIEEKFASDYYEVKNTIDVMNVKLNAPEKPGELKMSTMWVVE